MKLIFCVFYFFFVFAFYLPIQRPKPQYPIISLLIFFLLSFVNLFFILLYNYCWFFIFFVFQILFKYNNIQVLFSCFTNAFNAIHFILNSLWLFVFVNIFFLFVFFLQKLFLLSVVAFKSLSFSFFVINILNVFTICFYFVCHKNEIQTKEKKSKKKIISIIYLLLLLLVVALFCLFKSGLVNVVLVN